MNPKTAPIVGIDLGTTFSALAYLDGGDVRLIQNPLGDVLTPSVVAYDERAQGLVVGRTAKDILALKPRWGAAGFKRSMGTERRYRIGEDEHSPVELSAYVLDALKRDAEHALGCRVSRCVITVPAYFNEAQRVATKKAGELAGLFVDRILNEPTAAAIAYGLQHAEDESTFLVFDLGGGTFDVCILELFDGMLEVKAVAGESRLGGEDFTDRLCRFLLERTDLDPARAERADPEAWSLLYKRVELLKRRLSSWSSSALEIPPFRGLTKQSQRLDLTAEEAEEAYRPLVERLLGPCRTALRGAALQAGDLAEIILVGGATRMPVVRRFATQLFGREPLADTDPDLTVARGAAIQAALIADDAAVGDLVVTDVASHSLGVDTTLELGSRHQDGYFCPIIHRNTTIPTSRCHSFSPVHPSQKIIEFSIYEGESRRVENNVKIGSLTVPGIPKAPRDQSVLVTFTYDLNGILEVEATIVDTGEVRSKVFHRGGGELSAEQAAAVAERIRSIKAHPRDQIRHRDLLARAELLWQDLPEAHREGLELVLHAFENALESRVPDDIEVGYQTLNAYCDAFDQGERW